MKERENVKGYKAVILAGGKGTRLYPITKQIPKPLLPIGKKPILSHLVDLFLSHGIQDIAVLVNKEFQDDFLWWNKRYHPDVKIEIFTEQEPLGTFGGLGLLKDWTDGKPFFLTNGDELKEIDLKQMALFHERVGLVGTIALAEVSNPKDYGVVVSNADLVEEFLEKPEHPPTNFISSGLYVFSPKIFDYHSGLQFTMIEKDIFPKLVKEKKLAAFKSNGKWTDCGTWERYEKAIQEWE